MTTRLVLAEAHPLMADGIVAALEQSEEFEVVAAVADVDELRDAAERLRPDALVVDVNLARGPLRRCVEVLRAREPRLAVVVLAEDDEAGPQAMAEIDAGAYLSKTVAPAALPSVLAAVLAGGASPRASAEPRLTPREQAVLDAAVRGLTNQEVATELAISLHTVKFHLANAYRKLGVATRTQAAARRGLP